MLKIAKPKTPYITVLQGETIGHCEITVTGVSHEEINILILGEQKWRL